jgi:hypothetical protein
VGDNGKRIQIPLRMLPASVALLDAAARRLGVSRQAVAEALVRQFARQVTADHLPAGHHGIRGGGRRKIPGKSSGSS